MYLWMDPSGISNNKAVQYSNNAILKGILHNVSDCPNFRVNA